MTDTNVHADSLAQPYQHHQHDRSLPQCYCTIDANTSYKRQLSFAFYASHQHS